METIAALLSDGKAVARTLPWQALRYEHTQAVRAKLVEQFAPRTVNRHLAALRGVLRECWRLGLMTAEESQRAADLPDVRVETLPRGRMLSPGELRGLFEVCARDARPNGRRDAAILAVLYGADLRRAEVAALAVDDFNPDTGELRVRGGKGRKDRTAYATNGALAALRAWLEVRGWEKGRLFVRINKGGKICGDSVTDQGIYRMLQTRAAAAGVQRFTPHDMRYSFVSSLLDHGAEISTVQRLAGHANVATTTRYDRRDEEAKRKAAELLLVPFVDHSGAGTK